MVPPLFYYQLALLAIIWLFVMLHLTWLRRSVTTPTAPATPLTPKRTRSNAPKAFEGLRHKPHCALCERDTVQPKAPPPTRPDPMPPTNRRPREVDTSMHFCPHSDCDYRGWLELGNLRANGHPSGGPWRQFHCLGCKGYFPEHHGTIFHGKQASVELIVRSRPCRVRLISRHLSQATGVIRIRRLSPPNRVFKISFNPANLIASTPILT